jgi:hypothetical protein
LGDALEFLLTVSIVMFRKLVAFLFVFGLIASLGTLALASDDGDQGIAEDLESCVQQCEIRQQSCEVSCPPESLQCPASCQDAYEECVDQC